MRLWHKDLIKYLPREQLVAQWRECSAIAGAIIKNGTPNHLLVNYILDYPIEHFIFYSIYVRKEMAKRGYKTMQKVEDKIWSLLPVGANRDLSRIPYEDLFKDHHDDTYLQICLWNLYEKYIREGFQLEEYNKDLFKDLINWREYVND